MRIPSTDMQSIAARMDKLESQNRKWKMATILLGLATASLVAMKNGMWVKVCGMITVRQRPGTAKGVLFITIEDESGFANLVLWADVFERYRKEILRSRLFMAEGHLQVEGEVVHVVVKRCFDVSALLRGLSLSKDVASVQHIFYKGRNFK